MQDGKELAYFQNMDSVSLEGVKMRPEIHIKPNDELTITVTSTNPEAAEPFNMTLRRSASGSSSTGLSIISEAILQQANCKSGAISI